MMQFLSHFLTIERKVLVTSLTSAYERVILAQPLENAAL